MLVLVGWAAVGVGMGLGYPNPTPTPNPTQVEKQVRAIATKGKMAGVSGTCWCVSEA